MAYNSSHTGAELDSAVVDLTALLSSGGLGKNLILQNDFQLRGKQTGGIQRDLIGMDASDRVHLGESDPIVLHSPRVLVSGSGTATGTASTFADDLVIDGASNRGLSIIAGNTNLAALNLGDPDDTSAGRIEYDNATDRWNFRTIGNVLALRLSSDADVSIPNGSLRVSGGTFGVGESESLTIAAGVVTPTASFIDVDTEASAAADDLDTITVPNAEVGTILIVRGSNSLRDVTLKDGAGNLILASDFTITTTSDRIVLISSSSSWFEISRSDNS